MARLRGREIRWSLSCRLLSPRRALCHLEREACRIAPVFSLREPGSSISLSPAEGRRGPSSRRTRNPLAAKSWSPYVLDDVLDFRVFFRRVLSRCNTAACPLSEPEPRPHVMCLACCCSVRRRHAASRASDIHMCSSAMAYSMRRPAFGSSKVRAAETRDLCWPICKGVPGTDAEYM